MLTDEFVKQYISYNYNKRRRIQKITLNSSIGVESKVPKCKDFKGNDRDYWFIYRQTKNLQYYAYLDNTLEDLFSSYQHKYLLNDTATSPLYKTVVQMSDPDFGYLVYSEQFNEVNGKLGSERYGHTKGFIIFNSDGEGIHIQHSLPQFPRIDANHVLKDPWIPLGGKIENQQFLCYGFHDISVFTTYIARNKALVQLYKPVNNFNVLNPYTSNPDFNILRIELTSLVGKIVRSQTYYTIRHACINSWNACIYQYIVDIPSLGNVTYFTKFTIDANVMVKRIRTSFAVYPNNENGVTSGGAVPKVGYDLWANVPNTFGKNFWIFTSLKKGNIFPHQSDNGIVDVYSLDHREMMDDSYIDPNSFKIGKQDKKDGNLSPQTANDHSKIAFLIDPDLKSNDPNDTMFCSADINRQTAQHIRGGGILCFSNKILTSYFSRAVTFLINPRQTADLTKYSVTDRRPVYVYLQTDVKISIPDRNNKPIYDKINFEVIDRYSIEDTTPIVYYDMPKYPRRFLTTNSNGKHDLSLMVLRNILPDDEPYWLPTKNMSSQFLVNLHYIPSDNQLLFCTSIKCETKENSMSCPLELAPKSSDQNYPDLASPSKPASFNLLPKIKRNYVLGTCDVLKAKYIVEDLLEYWDGLKLYDKIKQIRIRISRTRSDFFYNGGDPYLQIYENHITSKDLISHLLTQYIIYSKTSEKIYMSTFTTSTNRKRFMGLVTAISKLIHQDLDDPSKPPENTIDSSLRSYLDDRLQFTIDTNYNIEKPDLNLLKDGFYQYASGIWDLIDNNNDKGYGANGYVDGNDGKTLDIDFIVENLKTGLIREPEGWRDFIKKNKFHSSNTNILYYNYMTSLPITNTKKKSSSLSILSNNININITKDILINAGLDKNDVNDLSDQELILIQTSLDQWININGSSAAIISLFNESSTFWNSYQSIFYLQQVDSNRNVLYSSSLCVYENDTSDGYRICDPLSIVDLTNAITYQIDEQSSLSPIVIGDLTVYYRGSPPDQNSPFDSFPEQSGIAIATLNSKICDIQLGYLSEFTNRSILGRICLEAGPIIDSVDKLSGPTTGNFPITINGINFNQNDQVVIGSVLCSQTTFISTNQLICLVSPNTGYNQLIAINPNNNYYQPEIVFKFNFDKPNLVEISQITTQLSNRTLIIRGNGFGVNVNDVVLQMGTNTDSILVTVLSVTDNEIQGIFTKELLSYVRLLKINIKNQYLIVKLQVEWNWTTSTTQTLYPGDFLSIGDLIYSVDDDMVNILVGELICEVHNATTCIVPQGFSKQIISIEDQYSQEQSSSFIQYDVPTFTSIASNKIGVGKVVYLFGKGLATSEDIDFFKVGSNDITANCQSFNNWVSCILPTYIIGLDLPISMSVGGQTVVNAPGLSTTISIFTPYIQSIIFDDNFNQTRISVTGNSFFTDIVDTFLLSKFNDNTTISIPIQCETVVLCTVHLDPLIQNKILISGQLSFSSGSILSNVYSIEDQDSISGYLFLDTNRDSIFTPTSDQDQPVHNITIQLTDVSGNQREWTTGPDGMFKFRYLKKSIYILNIKDLTFNGRLEILSNVSNPLQKEWVVSVIQKIQLNTSKSSNIIYNMPLQPLLKSTDNFYNCTGRFYSSANNSINVQYGTTNIYPLQWCDPDSFQICQYPFTSYIIDQDYCTFYIDYKNGPTPYQDIIVKYTSTISIKLIDDPYFTGTPNVSNPISTKIQFYMKDLNETITINVESLSETKIEVPPGNISINFISTTSKSASVNNIQIFISPFQNYEMNSYFYDGSQTVAIFYDSVNTTLSLPISVISEPYLMAIGWVDRIKVFETSSQFAIYLFSQDNINSPIVLPGINGRVETTGINKRIEISFSDISSNPVRGLGEHIKLARANSINIFINGLQVISTKIDNLLSDYNFPSIIGNSIITFTWRDIKLFNQLNLNYIRQYDIDQSTPTQVYLDSNNVTGNKIDHMYYLWPDVDTKYNEPLGLYTEIVVNYTGIYLICGQSNSQYFKGEGYFPSSSLDPTIEYMLYFKPGYLCMIGKLDGIEYYCHSLEVPGIRYLQMVKYGFIYQNYAGDIVNSYFCRYSMPQQYPANKRIHPIALNTQYLDANDTNRNTLQQGEFLSNGQQYAFLESNGKLVIYDSYNKSNIYYTSDFEGTNPVPPAPYRMVLGKDGNLCVFGSDNTIYWCINSQLLGGRYFLLSPIDIISHKYEMMILNNAGDLVSGRFDYNYDYVYNRVPYIMQGMSLYDKSSPLANYQRTVLNIGQFLTNGREYLILKSTGLYLYSSNPFDTMQAPVTYWSKPAGSIDPSYVHIVNSTTLEIVGGSGTIIVLKSIPTVHYFNLHYPGSSSKDWALLFMSLNQEILNGFLSIPVGNTGNYVNKYSFTTPQPIVSFSNSYLTSELIDSSDINVYKSTDMTRFWGLTDYTDIPFVDLTCLTSCPTAPQYRLLWDSTIEQPSLKFTSRFCSTGQCNFYEEYFNLPPSIPTFKITTHIILPPGIPEMFAINIDNSILWNANISTKYQDSFNFIIK